MNCIYRSKQSKCRLAGQRAMALPIVVTDEQCAACQAAGGPAAKDNATLVSLAKQAKAAFKMTPAKPIELDESKFPCQHRGLEVLRTHKCVPCDGGSEHAIYQCSKLNRECSVHAAGKATDREDGKPIAVCIGCEHLPELSSNP